MVWTDEPGCVHRPYTSKSATRLRGALGVWLSKSWGTFRQVDHARSERTPILSAMATSLLLSHAPLLPPGRVLRESEHGLDDNFCWCCENGWNPSHAEFRDEKRGGDELCHSVTGAMVEWFTRRKENGLR